MTTYGETGYVADDAPTAVRAFPGMFAGEQPRPQKPR